MASAVASAAVPGPIPAISSQPEQQQDVEENEWTDECNELLGQVLETQTEIATLLKTHGDTQQSLKQMKKQCDDEVCGRAFLLCLRSYQHTATKLDRACALCCCCSPFQLVELQDDAWKLQVFVELQRMGQQLERLASQDEGGLSTKDQGCAGGDDKPHASTDGDSNHQADLDDLDKEIAELDKQLVAARAELQGLLQDKVELEGQVVLTGQQLEALAVQEAGQ
jgi:hypothetical protein